MGSMVNFTITSSLSSFASERRFGLDTQISALKGKLELITGCSAGSMKLQMFDKENKFLADLDHNGVLSTYNPEDGMRIHVIDEDPTKAVGEYEDVTKVEKYEIADEEYEKREDSVRNFLKNQRMGRFSDQAKNAEEAAALKEKEEEKKATSMSVGSRCEARVAKQPAKRGTVRYVGLVDFKSGYWVGVQYDEPVGKNDGSVKGKRYFECPDKYGGFVRPSQVTIGDFPEEQFDIDDEM